MSVQWLPDGDSVIVSGNTSLGIVTRDEDDGEWSICHEDKISHSKIITSVFAISEELITTCSGDDSTVKIWRLNQDGCECLKEIKLEAPPISILYDNKTKCLVMMDKSLNLGVMQKDFDSKSEEVPAAVDEKA
jgi:WD40 repeat protein